MDVTYLMELKAEELSCEESMGDCAWHVSKEWAKTSPHKEGCMGEDWNKGNRFNGT